MLPLDVELDIISLQQLGRLAPLRLLGVLRQIVLATVMAMEIMLIAQQHLLLR